jgi:type I restriction enzyme R subunit
MTIIGQPERATQNRVIALFQNELGYRYIGDWTDRQNNSDVEETILTAYLSKNGYTPAQISSAIYKLRIEADNPNRSLYDNNKEVYKLLRYGAPVKIEAGTVTETVNLINWNEASRNDFAIAEEVTLRGNFERRPDLVLYVNGIAVGVLEPSHNSRFIALMDQYMPSWRNHREELNQSPLGHVDWNY